MRLRTATARDVVAIGALAHYGAWRYRIPMEPFMIIVAAPLLVRVRGQRAALADALARLGPEARLAGD